MLLPMLSPLEARVLGVLVEKQRTVPDTYPLTLNAIVAGCNQKTSRDPIMTVSEPDVQAAIDRAEGLSLVVEIERRPRDALRAQHRARAWHCRRSRWRCWRC